MGETANVTRECGRKKSHCLAARRQPAIARWLLGGTLGLLAILWSVGTALADDACPPTLTDWQRPGYVAVSGNWPQTFDVSMLNAGWVVDHTTTSSIPSQMDRALVIRTPSGFRINAAKLSALVEANPGATWLISSEPDSIWNDNLLPEEYAHIYHNLYAFIKGRDSLARIAAGGIVQPTPLRLAYLDRVLAAYQAAYHSPLPADLWQIHNAVLNEQRGSWGADIPPGFDEDEGVVRQVNDNDNITLFRQQIWAFRQWMADRGYGGYPLIVTEYGVLMPAEYGFTVPRVNSFMTNTFDFFATATDPTLGDPHDGFRLVQRWAWFSLDVPPWDPLTGIGFNGNLFDPDTSLATAFATHFASLTSAIQPTVYVDLGPARWQVEPLPLVSGPTQTVTATVSVRVVNGGSGDAGPFAVDLSWEGPNGGSARQQVAGMTAGSAQWLDWVLLGLSPGHYQLTVHVDALDQVVEAAECNNVSQRGLVVPTYRIWLPIAGSNHSRSVTQDGGGGKAAQAAPMGAPAGPTGSPFSLARAPSQSAGFVEFPLPTAGSFPGQMALDPASGRLWVTERDGNKLARFDPATGQWEEWTIPTPNSQPWGLALDEAGNVWFAETAANQIGQWLAATEEIVEYPVPTVGSQPWGIDAGGGAVWFTERAASQLGRLDMASGDVVEYATLSPNALPGGIELVLDSTRESEMVWFAEAGVDRLGFYDATLAVMREFGTLPHEFPQVDTPEDVSVLPGGNAWMSNAGSDSISLFQYTTIQRFSSFLAPTAGSQPYGIDTYGNSAVWFTERAAARLGRFGREGHISEFALPVPGSQPTDIIAESEECAWYTAPDANRIGHFCRILTYLPLVRRAETKLDP